MDQLLKELVERLKSQFGQRLISVVLYGSAASGEQDREFSDLNILCVLDHVDASALEQSEPVFRWWASNKQPAPLLMSAHEVATSTDCFPIEFQDMKNSRRVLHGKDVVQDLSIDYSFYRAQIEYELRTKLLRLRQRAAPLLSKPEDLLRLCADSVSTFCVLGRHALLISGHAASPHKRTIVSGLTTALGRPFGAFESLLDIREGKRPPQADQARQLFDEYLTQIQATAEFVDRLQK